MENIRSEMKVYKPTCLCSEMLREVDGGEKATVA